MEKVKITLVKSTIDRPAKQKKTIQSLGLNKLNSVIEAELTPSLQGMIDKVNHLIFVEKV